MVRGSDLVVTAIWEGREAGKSIIKYISWIFLTHSF
jgi:glutamate synthase (NADPH/NADH) small chain